MIYRTNREIKLRDKLRQEEEEELEQIAQDLDESFQIELRLRSKGLVEQEDREKAKKYVIELLEEIKQTEEKKKEGRKRLFGKIKKVGTVAAIVTTVAAVVGAPIYATAHYWNTRDEALGALAKYDKPVKITDPKEREEVISHLDEIFEEHAFDFGSDMSAQRYLMFLETNGFSIIGGAKWIDTYGTSFFETGPLEHFISENRASLKIYENMDLQRKECLANITTAFLEKEKILEMVSLYNHGYCQE